MVVLLNNGCRRRQYNTPGDGMTINQYLCMLEVLQIRRDRAFERYVRLLERASAPAAAHIDPDGIKIRSGYNSREDLLIKVADAAAAEDKAWKQYEAFKKGFERNLGKLEYTERLALEQIYIFNMGKPPERRRTGVCRWCGCRTKAEAAELIRQAKHHLTEILRARGVDIE